MPDAKLVVVGSGPFKKALEDLTQKLGIGGSVIFTGPVAWRDVAKYYRLGDVSVTASTSETQGLTYIESIASGTVVVARADESINGIIIDGVTGYTFAHNDGAADAMLRAFAEKDRKTEIISAAREKIAHLSATHFAKNVEKVYLQAIEVRKARKARKQRKK
jgi:1,2-diacylglycerol 3-alpha-glucosyltransferase